MQYGTVWYGMRRARVDDVGKGLVHYCREVERGLAWLGLPGLGWRA